MAESQSADPKSVSMDGQPMGDPHPCDLTRAGQHPVTGALLASNEKLSSGDAIACISMALQNPPDIAEWIRLLGDCRHVIERLEDELTEAKRQRNDEQRLRLAAEHSHLETSAPLACENCGTLADGGRSCCPEQRHVPAQVLIEKLWRIAYVEPVASALKTEAKCTCEGWRHAGHAPYCALSADPRP